MNRKYLDDINCLERPDTLLPGDKREEKWKKQREEYGFDVREVWNLDYTFYIWLYERLLMYIETADGIIDLDYHKIDFKGKEYTQRQLIQFMIDGCKNRITKNDFQLTKEEESQIEDIVNIWAIILPTMWW